MVVLENLAEGRIDVDQAERLLKTMKRRQTVHQAKGVGKPRRVSRSGFVPPTLPSHLECMMQTPAV
jgi:hypothetical protein